MGEPGAPQYRSIFADVDVYDRALLEIIDIRPAVQRVAAGFGFTEGPVWVSGALVFSDIPNNRIVRWRRLPEGPEITTYATGRSNGLARDRSGCIIVAEHWGRRVSRIEKDGTRTCLADRFQDKKLNSPNDIVIDSKGVIYFTDPPMGVKRHTPGAPRAEGWWKAHIPEKEQTVNGVYRLEPNGKVTLVAADLMLPNGLTLSPDESRLYVDDSALNHVRAFSVAPDGSLRGGEILFEMKPDGHGEADGLKVDRHGNIFCTGPRGIWITDPKGHMLGLVTLPELPANLAWGEDGTVLFVTADTGVYRLQTRTAGAV